MHHAEGAGEAAQRDGRSAAIGEMREIAEVPGGAEQAALARIVAVHRLADVVGVVGDRRAP